MSAWPRDAFVAAVWASDQLTSTERLVALCFADHALDRDHAWVTYGRIRERTGIRSNDTVTRVVRSLSEAGWLVLKEQPSQNRPGRYLLSTPSGAPMIGAPTVGEPEPHAPMIGAPMVSAGAPMIGGGAPMIGDDYSAEQTADSSAAARAAGDAPPAAEMLAEHRPIVADLLARLGPEVTEAEVAACVAWVAESKSPSNLGGYVFRFTAEDVRARAAQATDRGRAASTSSARKCPHGVRDGLEVLGLGANASRRCARCEASDPAPDVAHMTGTSRQERAS